MPWWLLWKDYFDQQGRTFRYAQCITTSAQIPELASLP